VSSDRGSVTVLSMAVVVVAMLLVAGLAAGGQLLGARIAATAAADAAALAAAPLTFRPFGSTLEPPQEAARFAEKNGAQLISCVCPLDSTYAARTATVVVARSAVVLGIWPVTVRASSAAEFRPADLLFDR